MCKKFVLSFGSGLGTAGGGEWPGSLQLFAFSSIKGGGRKEAKNMRV